MINFLIYLAKYVAGVVAIVAIGVLLYLAVIWSIIWISELVGYNTYQLRKWAKFKRKEINPAFKKNPTADIDALIVQETERLEELTAKKQKQAELNIIKQKIDQIT